MGWGGKICSSRSFERKDAPRVKKTATTFCLRDKLQHFVSRWRTRKGPRVLEWWRVSPVGRERHLSQFLGSNGLALTFIWSETMTFEFGIYLFSSFALSTGGRWWPLNGKGGRRCCARRSPASVSPRSWSGRSCSWAELGVRSRSNGISVMSNCSDDQIMWLHALCGRDWCFLNATVS